MFYLSCTKTGFWTLHRIFGHLSINALKTLLKHVEEYKLNNEPTKSLQKIKEDCRVCKEIRSGTRERKLTVASDVLKVICILILYRDFVIGRPVIHMVGWTTHFRAAAFLHNQSTYKW